MLISMMYCLTVAWGPSTGPVDSYTMFVDDIIYQEDIPNTEIIMCLNDLNPHRVTVQAFTVDGVASPMSDESENIQMIIVPPLKAVHASNAVKADFDGSGTVDGGDFGVVAHSFGKSNNGMVEVPC